MMINKRLINTVEESKRYIAGNVILQWLGLLANAGIILIISRLISGAYNKSLDDILLFGIALFLLIGVRFLCTRLAGHLSYLSSKTVKKVLRDRIYEKLLRLGAGYTGKVSTASVVQVAVEGVEQLETYFGAYLPQFFYSMIAPVTLFLIISPISLASGTVLLLCVPLIPGAIMIVQKTARKIFSGYWSQYTSLGDSFLENIQGLTTLKIYQADGYRHEEMNKESEKFRKVTMKVLTMQLNSIVVMDLIAYGGASLGGILGITGFQRGNISLFGCLVIILISADFFLPMRQLGSYFHVAMNGMAACDKIFALLDTEEDPEGKLLLRDTGDITCKNLSFSYREFVSKDRISKSPQAGKEVLKGLNLIIPAGSFTAFVGESGCGKSTIAGILTGRLKGYGGSITIGEANLPDIKEEELMKNITYISHNNYLFKGTVRENLKLGDKKADDSKLWEILEKMELADFLRSEQGLDTKLAEGALNLSGGQRQRLALARAFLHDSPIYIFDEATSNIDVESEHAILRQIKKVIGMKTVIMISHRLANVTAADKIYCIDAGKVSEEGTHNELLKAGGVYSRLWNTQQKLEDLEKEVDSCE